MKIRAVSLLLATLPALPSVAQGVSDYDKMRESILGDYNNFRRSVLDGYASYLEGVWHDYTAFRGEERSPKPKPQTAPALPEVRPATPQQQPTAPEPSPAPSPTAEQPTTKQPACDRFMFYNIPVDITHTDINLLKTISKKSDFAAQWRALESKGTEAGKSLAGIAAEMGLNDYLTFELVMAWANGTFGHASEASRLSLTHFIMTGMGYDLRLASSSDGTAMLLIPFRQKVYGRPYLTLNGRRYYAFPANPGSVPSLGGSTISTCDIPTSVNAGKVMDLRLKPLKLPYSPHRYHLAYGGISIEGEVNANIFPLLYHYPQMPMTDYALSVAAPDVRKAVISDIASQIKSDTPRTIADTLLNFVQNAFDYSTDRNYHGFEKPYFFEEMLFYPKCDCEDRAIFYATLLWHAFRLENHIINYPGHESVAVRLDDGLPGDHYLYKNSRFYISDPTFIGAHTGMTMPDYRETKPEIDHIYSEK